MNDYYIELAKIFKAKEIYANQYSAMNKEWLIAKYYHSLNVIETGEQIISQNKNLSSVSPEEYETMVNALLMHDFARSHEKKEDGSTAFRFHGAEGMQMLIENYHIYDLRILFPILMHDQMNKDFMEQSDADLKKNSQYTVLRPEIQKNILDLRKRYNLLSAYDKQLVNWNCALVKDADTLANMKDYEIMFPLTKETKEAKISPAVWDAVSKGEYVNYNDVKTLPDRAMAYFAWAFKFQYPETLQVAENEHLFDKMQQYVIDNVRSDQKDKNPNLEAELKTLSEQFDYIKGLLNQHKKTLKKYRHDDVMKVNWEDEEDIIRLLDNPKQLKIVMSDPNAVAHLEPIFLTLAKTEDSFIQKKRPSERRDILATLAQANGQLPLKEQKLLLNNLRMINEDWLSEAPPNIVFVPEEFNSFEKAFLANQRLLARNQMAERIKKGKYHEGSSNSEMTRLLVGSARSGELPVRSKSDGLIRKALNQESFLKRIVLNRKVRFDK